MADNRTVKHCQWCGAPTVMEQMQLADTPILEFVEDKIDKLGRNKVWGENSDCSNVNILCSIFYRSIDNWIHGRLVR